MKKQPLTYPLYTLTFAALLVIHGYISVILLPLFSSGWSFIFLLFAVNIYFLVVVGSALLSTIILLIKKRFFVKVPLLMTILLLGIQLLVLFSLPADCGDCGGQSWAGPLGVLFLPLLVVFVVVHNIVIWTTLKNAVDSLKISPQIVKKSFLSAVGICTWLGSYSVSTMVLYTSVVTGKLSIPTISTSWNFAPILILAALKNTSDPEMTLFLWIISSLISLVVALVPAIFITLLINIWWQTTINFTRFRWLVFGVLVIMLVSIQFMLLPKLRSVILTENIQRHVSCAGVATNFHDFRTCLTKYMNFTVRSDGVLEEKRVDKIISNCEHFPTIAPNFTEDADANIAQCSGYTQRDFCKLLSTQALFVEPHFDNLDDQRNQLLFTEHLKLCRHLGGIQTGTCQITKQDYCLYSLSKPKSIFYIRSSDLSGDYNHCSYISNTAFKHQCLTERCYSLYPHSPDKAKTCIQQLM